MNSLLFFELVFRRGFGCAAYESSVLQRECYKDVIIRRIIISITVCVYGFRGNDVSVGVFFRSPMRDLVRFPLYRASEGVPRLVYVILWFKDGSRSWQICRF